MALLPVPVAVYALKGKRTVCAGLVACAALGVALPMASPVDGLLNGCIAASGLVVAEGIRRCWRYSRIVVAVSAPVIALLGVNMALRWHKMMKLVMAALANVQAQAAKPLSQRPDANAQAMLQLYQWLYQHWSTIAAGVLVATTVTTACVGISLTSMWLRRVMRRPGPIESFRSFAVPDWLAWVVIATAVAGYVDYYRLPGTALRPVAWSAGVALAGLYWLNGLAILAHLVYVATVLNARAAGLLMAGATIVFFSPLVITLGLFDTWFGFRGKLDKLVEIKRRIDESRDDDE